MRPGHLGDLQDCWFGSLEGEYFEVLENRSADPIFALKDRLQGKTGEEFKAVFNRGGPVSVPISKIGRRPYSPYNLGPPGLQRLTNYYNQNIKMFKLS